MFSYDDRMKAVLLYIKYDRGAAATVPDLGYPTPKTLKKWYQEYIALGDIGVSRTRKRRFTPEQERLAVDYYLEHGRRVLATIRALGYPCRVTLRQWIQERCPDIRTASVQHRRHEPFSEDEKRHAVIDLCARDGSAAAVADSCREGWCQPSPLVPVATSTPRTGDGFREETAEATARS